MSLGPCAVVACSTEEVAKGERDPDAAGGLASGGLRESGGTTSGGAPSTGGVGVATGAAGPVDDGLPSFEQATGYSAQEFVFVSWHPRKGAIYSLDVKPEGQPYIAPCVGGSLLERSLSHVFDGRCPSAGNVDVQAVEAFRLCSSIPTSDTTWNSATVQCTEVPYDGGTRVAVPNSLAADAPVAVRWPYVPGASYAMHLELASGQTIDNCAGAAFLKDHTSLAFDGTCPTSDVDPGLSVVKTIRIDAALGSHWDLPSSRRTGSSALETGAKEVLVELGGFRNHVAAENCGPAPDAALSFGEAGNLAADLCSEDEPSAAERYLKRRYTETDETKVMAYPRSYTYGGYSYSLFATPPGGFAPAGQSGCSELNLIRTQDFKSYQVTQLERLCGYTRLDNGELAVIGGRMFVVYHTISANDGCTAPGNVPGREWLLRMKVSDDFEASQPTFHDLGGADGFDTIRRLCLPNADNDGFWEPMIYEAENGALQVAYTDDTPSEAADGSCNQYIRVATFSRESRTVTSDVAVGDCPGDKRDGMPVVQRNASGKYFMAIESLGAPSSQIVLLRSEDGGLHFGERRVLAEVASDGGYGVGCPYLAFDGDSPYASYYQLFNAPSGASFGAFMVRGWNADLTLRSEQVVEMRRRWSGADDLDILYWGGIHVTGRHLHLVGSNWSHPFVEAWVPLL